MTGEWTEALLLDRLRARHDKSSGNGPEWVYMQHVRGGAGFDQRTIDALAMHLWPSRSHEVHAFEVKISRNDWRRELAQPEKSACWLEWVDYFWVVAPASIVAIDELPASWGLLIPRGAALTTARQAKRLRPKPLGYMPADPIARGQVAAMLRAAARISTAVDTPSIAEHLP